MLLDWPQIPVSCFFSDLPVGFVLSFSSTTKTYKCPLGFLFNWFCFSNYLLVFEYAFVLISKAENTCSWSRYSGISFCSCFCLSGVSDHSLLFLSTETKKLLNVLWSGILIYLLCLFSRLPNKNIFRYFCFMLFLRIIWTGSFLIVLNLLKYAGTSLFCCLLSPSSRLTSLFHDWLPCMFLVLTRFILVIMVDLKPFP